MSDAYLIERFMQVREEEGRTLLEIAIVEWPHPHEPRLAWHKLRSWAEPPDATILAEAQEKALRNRRFFRDCELCGERCNRGHMHDAKTCQGCAERHLGIVH
jgi:hypothetical protein